MAAPAPDAKRTSLGIATTSYMTARRFRDTLEFLEHCHKLGAPGIQTALTSLDRAYLDKVKARLQETGMYIEVMAALPKVDMAQFLATVDGAKHVGAHCIRAGALSGRRYETFATLDDWRKFVSDSKAAIARAVPVVEKTRIPLALENHKDWTVDEMVTLLKSYSSEYFGALLDTGNNISLLDDPMEVVERLAPFAIATHIKDMGVAGVSRRLPLIGGGHRRRIPEYSEHSQHHQEGAPEDQHGSRDDYSRPVESAGLHRQVLGNLPRSQRYLHGAHAANGSGQENRSFRCSRTYRRRSKSRLKRIT